jgi:hypothetical protein
MSYLEKNEPEPFYTLKQAAKILNVKYWLLLRAAGIGLFPTYTFFNTRRLVRLSEVAAAVERSACAKVTSHILNGTRHRA